MPLKTNKYKISRTDYGNGISCKFDNRRVTVCKKADNFLIQFKKLVSHDYVPPVTTGVYHGCQITEIRLSQEVAEIVMLNLAEMMGYKMVEVTAAETVAT